MRTNTVPCQLLNGVIVMIYDDVIFPIFLRSVICLILDFFKNGIIF